MPLLSPSGGIVYHLRAARYRSSLWAPFRERLAAWLDERLEDAPELLLVGPSAGHCLPLDQLARYGRVTGLEPDWWAAALLRARLRGAVIARDDLLLRPLLEGGPGLDALLDRRPRSAVLFCNVLGQLHFGLEDEQQVRFQEEFRRRVLPALSGRPWASFHDRWSFDLEPDAARPRALDFDRQPTDEQLAAAWFGDGPRLSALDHGTASLFPGELPRRYFGWQLTPAAYHLVEGVAGF